MTRHKRFTGGMKLIFLITSLDFGGAEAQLVRIAIKLKQAGWCVSVVSMLSPAAYEDTLNAAGVTLHSLNMKRGAAEPAAVLRLVRLLRQEQPAILTTFMYHANLLGRLAGRLARVPAVVSSIRNENFGGPSRERVMRLTDRLATATTTNSRLAATSLLRRRVVPAAKLRVIPNGLDVPHYRWTAEERMLTRTELGVSASGFLWFAAGRLEEQKDYPTLLQAFSKVARKRPEAELRIAGRGSLQETLQGLLQKLGLVDQVAFLGARSDIPRLLAASDSLVLSSAWEGLPNIVIEAMAAGKPVVATETGGVAELVTTGTNGFLVAPGQPAALADAMLSLMELPAEEQNRLGLAGRLQATGNYSIEQVVGKWQALFLELLDKRQPEVTA